MIESSFWAYTIVTSNRVGKYPIQCIENSFFVSVYLRPQGSTRKKATEKLSRLWKESKIVEVKPVVNSSHKTIFFVSAVLSWKIFDLGLLQAWNWNIPLVTLAIMGLPVIKQFSLASRPAGPTPKPCFQPRQLPGTHSCFWPFTIITTTTAHVQGFIANWHQSNDQWGTL